MPFKTFSNGSVLTANEVNTFMMDQQIMVFENAAARDAALTSPTHGMITYLKNVNRMSFYNGTSWRLI